MCTGDDTQVSIVRIKKRHNNSKASTEMKSFDLIKLLHISYVMLAFTALNICGREKKKEGKRDMFN